MKLVNSNCLIGICIKVLCLQLLYDFISLRCKKIVMTRLSVNINKIATLRNARGCNTPNLVQVAKDIERFGAEGITVHPRPDERHIRYADVRELSHVLTTEFNVEGYPNKKFMNLVRGETCTSNFSPRSSGTLTSNAGWDTIKNKTLLTEILLS